MSRLLRRQGGHCVKIIWSKGPNLNSFSLPFWDSIDFEDVAAQFNQCHPGIDLNADHSALLAHIVMDALRQSGVEMSTRKASAAALAGEGQSNQSRIPKLASRKAATPGTVRSNRNSPQHYL